VPPGAIVYGSGDTAKIMTKVGNHTEQGSELLIQQAILLTLMQDSHLLLKVIAWSSASALCSFL
jgi:hypothetical protein